jgi:hypothetical protein
MLPKILEKSRKFWFFQIAFGGIYASYLVTQVENCAIIYLELLRYEPSGLGQQL